MATPISAGLTDRKWLLKTTCDVFEAAGLREDQKGARGEVER